jgi:anti-anti-sigma factor
MSTAPQPEPQPTEGAGLADPLGLHVEVVDEGWQVMAHVTGEIDIATCSRLRDAIEPHLGPRQRVVLDLSGVTFMDTSSLRVLEHARTRLTADGGSLVLRNPSSAAHRLLSMAQVASLFTTELG